MEDIVLDHHSNPPLAHHWPNLGSLSFGWQAFVGQTLAQRWQNLLIMQPIAMFVQRWAYVGKICRLCEHQPTSVPWQNAITLSCDPLLSLTFPIIGDH